MKSLSLVLPIYNEAGIIKEAVSYCIEVLSKDFKDFEIILINDGSKDQTGQVIEEIARQDKRIRVLDNLINLNLGISIQRGFKCASKEYVIFDAIDLPLDPADLLGLINAMEDNDILYQVILIPC